MNAALPQKHLKIYNLTITNAALMKLTTIVCLHMTFNLEKYWGVTSQNEPEKTIFGLPSGVF